ncbi:MAG: proline--tRNA ligase [Verrucomicrobia bacterium]|nr:proline--tRNA ligase [Verrucomicrobiota bacterium]
MKPETQPRVPPGGGAVSQKITPRAADYARWYLDVIQHAQLADHSAVRGCMVIRPNGYAIWEKMQRALDARFKATGHRNAYFPVFIPVSFLSKEAQHVEGFAKECAVVTHHRLRAKGDKSGVEVDPESKLEEPLIVRPTSETIIWSAYKQWIQSYRDLPILINQWVNVVRWEMRTRLFLRTAEFLWQEGHTAHATEKEAVEETRRMLDVYRDFSENVMAMPVICGPKTPGERFAGAVESFSIEAMMQDRRALQAGTSHYLGQNFAKAFDVQFLNAKGEREHVYAASWGVSTRLIGALIMTHSDDLGLVLPPRLADIQVVVVPIFKTEAEKTLVLEACERTIRALEAHNLEAHCDLREGMTPGAKYYDWEVKGVPLRIEIGPRDVESGKLVLVRRFVLEEPGDDEKAIRAKKKQFLSRDEAVSKTPAILDQMQQQLYQRALAFRSKHSRTVDSLEEYERFFKKEGGGFAWTHWAGSREDEEMMAKKYQTSIRNVPFERQGPPGSDGAGKCILTGKPSARRVLMSEAY